jgi:hypothetical protein
VKKVRPTVTLWLKVGPYKGGVTKWKALCSATGGYYFTGTDVLMRVVRDHSWHKDESCYRILPLGRTPKGAK